MSGRGGQRRLPRGGDIYEDRKQGLVGLVRRAAGKAVSGSRNSIYKGPEAGRECPLPGTQQDNDNDVGEQRSCVFGSPGPRSVLGTQQTFTDICQMNEGFCSESTHLQFND